MACSMALVGEGDLGALFRSCVMVADGTVFLTVVGSERSFAHLFLTDLRK